MKLNCWDVLKCGREPGGSKVRELGICKAANEAMCSGLNGGKNGGRICWDISGTLCGGAVQGTFAQKRATCISCDFFKQVREEEGVQNFKLKIPHSD